MLYNEIEGLEGSALERFVKFYESIGITTKIGMDEGDNYYIILGYDMYGSGNDVTTDPRFDGYTGFYSQITFSNKGEFISQEFYE